MSDDTNKAPERKGPADTVRDGRIKATMWERNGESGPPYGTTITRTYTDKDGKARDTPFLSGADLLRASRVADKAYEREQELMRERTQNPERGEDANERDERKAAHRSSRQRGTRRPRNRTRG
ncbi:hypothetical protein [Oceanicaulis alexandrii]|uniref:hypothetical protein n=1 Tax=Oceanicaulis alexandrii TaxID=153233 RepID=UPI003B506592